MKWLELLTAAGIGSLFSSLIVLAITNRYNHKQWIKKERIIAYKVLIEELLSKELYNIDTHRNIGFKNISAAILISDKKIANEIDSLYKEIISDLNLFIGTRNLSQEHGDDYLFEKSYKDMKINHKKLEEKIKILIEKLRKSVIDY